MLIKYNRKNLLNLGTITLKPGQQEISRAEWGKVATLYKPKLDHLIDEGVLNVFDEDESWAADPANAGAEGRQGGAPASPIAAMNERDAIGAVRECYDEKALERWVETEERPKVKKAITEQLEKIAKSLSNKDAK